MFISVANHCSLRKRGTPDGEQRVHVSVCQCGESRTGGDSTSARSKFGCYSNNLRSKTNSPSGYVSQCRSLEYRRGAYEPDKLGSTARGQPLRTSVRAPRFPARSGSVGQTFLSVLF